MPAKERLARNNPAAQALKKGRAFRDLRASESQITAEQLIAQAQELNAMTGGTPKEPTKLLLMSATELALYRQTTRAEFEANVRRSFKDFGTWVRYAQWEEEQDDIQRVRTIYERAVEHHGENKELWRQYAEAEQRFGTPDNARSVFRRATTSLPQCTELWLKYVAFEAAVHRDDNVRLAFQKWRAMLPPAYVWRLAVQFEAKRCRRDGRVNAEQIRDVLRDLMVHHNEASSWAFYAGVELHVLGDASRAIEVLQTALQALPKARDEVALHLLLAEALAMHGDIAEARRTYVELVEACTANAQCPNDVRSHVLTTFTMFERSHAAVTDGPDDDALTNAQARLQYRFIIDAAKQTSTVVSTSSTGANGSVLGCRRQLMDAYASLVALDAAAPSAGLLLSSSSSVSDPPAPRSTAAVSNLSNNQEDVVEAELFEAISIAPCDGVEVQQRATLVMALARRLTARGAFTEAIKLMFALLESFPHVSLKNPAIWIETCRVLLAQEGGTDEACTMVRRVMGQAIGTCPDEVVFRHYIALELGVLQAPDSIARCSALYRVWLERHPLSHSTWIAYAAFCNQHDSEGGASRGDKILQMGISILSNAAKEAASVRSKHKLLDDADALWKERLRMSFAVGQHTATRGVYEALMDAVVSQYFAAFDAWKASLLTAKQVSPPAQLGPVLQPAVRRLTAAVQGRGGFEIKTQQQPGEGCDAMRAAFKRVVEARRGSLNITSDTSFAQVALERQWMELSLSPIFNAWRHFEAMYGTAESLERVGQTAEPPKKKARLFKTSSVPSSAN